LQTNWLRLAADFLNDAAIEFSAHGCNDWDAPSGWTEKDIMELNAAISKWNGGDVKYPPDWLVMDFLASQLYKSVEEKPSNE